MVSTVDAQVAAKNPSKSMARHLVSPDRVLYIVADEADLDRVVGKPAHIFMTVVTPRDDMEFKQESLRKLLPSPTATKSSRWWANANGESLISPLRLRVSAMATPS